MQAALDHIRRHASNAPRVGVVLGSGLGGFAQELEEAHAIPYASIPDWPQSTAVGHEGKLVFGTLSGVPLVVMAGRFHLYEGYTPQQAVAGVRAMHALGVRTAIFTNAAGGINAGFARGALVAISDHINLQGANPLAGPNDDRLGPRFPDMTDAYTAELRAIALDTARELGITLHEGIYAAMLGPSYETPAEIRFLRTIGADLVGMSTVPEVIQANHLGLRVLAISCVTNMAAGLSGEKINHEEVLETGRMVRQTFVRLLKTVIPRLDR
ncbi:MAG: purine-nucleoside phosphorylase [Acidobacteria bacterium]|nr:purine-nucleoside phosphorylase [Acidobacteriota bacterium]